MVKWTTPAKRDLKGIHDYIAGDSAYYAKKVTETIISKSKMLNVFPEMGRMVPELAEPEIRELMIYSYRVIYEIKSDHVDVLAIVHEKRDFTVAFEEK